MEVDSDYHDDEVQKKIGEFRTVTLQKNGYTLIRFTNEEVLNKTDWVLKEIRKALIAESVSPSPWEREQESEVKIKITSSILEIGGEKDLEKGLQKAIDAKDLKGVNVAPN